MQLLSDRDDNEAFLSAKEGESYVVLFPKGGTVKIDLGKYPHLFSACWVSINTGEWGQRFSASGGDKLEITAPDASGWLIVLTRAN